jgi:hypothetical protein
MVTSVMPNISTRPGTQDRLPEKRDTTSWMLRACRGASLAAAAASGVRARQPCACATVAGYTSEAAKRAAHSASSSVKQAQAA